MKYAKIIFLLVLTVMLTGCVKKTTSVSTTDNQTNNASDNILKITASDFGDEEIVFVSLKDKKVYGESATIKNQIRNGQIVLDLFFEPEDPEIGGMGGNSLIKAGTSYDKISQASNYVWDNAVGGFDQDDNIAAGFTFLYKNSQNTVYKIRVDSLSDRAITITYAAIE